MANLSSAFDMKLLGMTHFKNAFEGMTQTDICPVVGESA
jgi:hypothetical protein